MKLLISILLVSVMVSCKGRVSGDAQKAGADPVKADPAKPLMDTAKLKQDLGAVISQMDGEHPPDTNVLKAAASDVLKTDADVLSDSAIDQLGNKNDPSVKAAQDAIKKMRNSMGITPAQLDSLRKVAASLH